MMVEAKKSKIEKVYDSAQRSHLVRGLKYLHDAVLGMLVLVVVATGITYAYERYTPITNHINPIAIVANQSEYAAKEPIVWYPMIEVSEKVTEVNVVTALRCDASNGLGFELISSDTQSFEGPFLNSTTAAQVKRSLANNIGSTFSATTAWLREYSTANRVGLFEYVGAIPKETSTCFGEHIITFNTPILGIQKTINIDSYPFDYVWYGIGE